MIRVICKQCGKIYWWAAVFAPDEDLPMCPECNVRTELYRGKEE